MGQATTTSAQKQTQSCTRLLAKPNQDTNQLQPLSGLEALQTINSQPGLLRLCNEPASHLWETNTRDTQSHFSAACTKHGSMSGCQNTPPPSCQLTCVSNSTAPTNRDYHTSRVSCSLKHKLIGTTARHTSCRAVTKLVNDTQVKRQYKNQSILRACSMSTLAVLSKQAPPPSKAGSACPATHRSTGLSLAESLTAADAAQNKPLLQWQLRWCCEHCPAAH